MKWTTKLFVLLFSTPVLTSDYLFDFRTLNTVEDWYEVSDTVRTQGSSKATIVLQNKTEKTSSLQARANTDHVDYDKN